MLLAGLCCPQPSDVKGDVMANSMLSPKPLLRLPRLHQGLRAAGLALSLSWGLAGAAAAASTQVFATDFEAPAVPAALAAGTATLTGVQGFAGLGATGNQFAGSFLRSASGNRVTLTLTGLAAHDSLSLSFLFAAIDSLDGTGSFPAGDFLNVRLDGVSIFRESFANALESQIQSYVAPPGGQLARRVELGFQAGGYYLDSAYDMGVDPRFQNLAHSASTAEISFEIEGSGVQDLSDESWALDNLRVSIASSVPEPATVALWALGLAGLTGLQRLGSRGRSAIATAR